MKLSLINPEELLERLRRLDAEEPNSSIFDLILSATFEYGQEGVRTSSAVLSDILSEHALAKWKQEKPSAV